jgi:hypothetical protein
MIAFFLKGMVLRKICQAIIKRRCWTNMNVMLGFYHKFSVIINTCNTM